MPRYVVHGPLERDVRAGRLCIEREERHSNPRRFRRSPYTGLQKQIILEGWSLRSTLKQLNSEVSAKDESIAKGRPSSFLHAAKE